MGFWNFIFFMCLVLLVSQNTSSDIHMSSYISDLTYVTYFYTAYHKYSFF